MESKYEILDKFVQITYLVNVLKVNTNKGIESFNNGFTSVKFKELGLADEIVSKLGPSPSLAALKGFQDNIEDLACSYSSYIYGTMVCDLSDEDKVLLKNYAETKSSQFATYANQYGNACLVLQGQMEKLLSSNDKSQVAELKVRIRDLGKAITLNSNKSFEYSSYSSSYSNIASYIKGILGSRFGLK